MGKRSCSNGSSNSSNNNSSSSSSSRQDITRTVKIFSWDLADPASGFLPTNVCFWCERGTRTPLPHTGMEVYNRFTSPPLRDHLFLLPSFFWQKKRGSFLALAAILVKEKLQKRLFSLSLSLLGNRRQFLRRGGEREKEGEGGGTKVVQWNLDISLIGWIPPTVFDCRIYECSESQIKNTVKLFASGWQSSPLHRGSTVIGRGRGGGGRGRGGRKKNGKSMVEERGRGGRGYRTFLSFSWLLESAWWEGDKRRREKNTQEPIWVSQGQRGESMGICGVACFQYHIRDLSR